MAYELTLENYQGPLEKLLQLIEERALDITQVSLAAVTDDFLRYLAALREEIEKGAGGKGGETHAGQEMVRADLRILADFLVVASRLVLIKSKSLLPALPLTEEEEEDIRDLESRLALYQKLKIAEGHIGGLWRRGHRAYSRPYFMAGLLRSAERKAGIFYPGGNCTREEILLALKRVYESLQKFIMATETITDKVVSLEEKMRDIARRMEAFAETTFRTLAEGAARGEAIVAFLAVLHLAREQLLILEQESRFSDIIIRKSTPSAPEFS